MSLLLDSTIITKTIGVWIGKTCTIKQIGGASPVISPLRRGEKKHWAQHKGNCTKIENKVDEQSYINKNQFSPRTRS